MSSLEFLSLGEQTIPGVPLRCVPLAAPNAEALYARRLEAALSSKADYVCFVDGGEDVCLPGFAEAMQALADAKPALGYASELVYGREVPRPTYSRQDFILDHSLVHHGVVCSTEALRRIKWPEGCFSWEVIAYGTLADQGILHDPVPRYDWRPGPHGARMWPSYCRAIINSKRWLQGLGTINMRGGW